MTAEQYIAQATALRVATAINRGSHLFCQELPLMDVERFLQLLAGMKLNLKLVSLALVGYQLTDADFRARLNNLGLAVGYATTDLHVAADWRNKPVAHPCIIALAVGRHPGVSTLAHFPQSTARELAEILIDWARTSDAGLIATSRQRDLLDALLEARELAPLVSLSGIADFLSAWKEARADNELDAPRRALPRLGLLPDRNLLSADRSVSERMYSNFALTRTLSSMAGSRLDAIRRRARKDADTARRDEVLIILARVDALRRTGDSASYGALEFEDAQKLVKPAKDEPPTNEPSTPSPDQPPEEPVPDAPEIRDDTGVAADGGSALIDGDDSRLEEIVAGVEAALADALDQESEEVKGSYEVGGEELPFQFPLDRGFLTWVRAFCSPDFWGGYYRTETTSFEEALADYRQCDPALFQPCTSTIAHDGETYDLRSILQPMQVELQRAGASAEDFCGLWDQIVAARNLVLSSLDILVQQPMLAIAGKAELAGAVAELVRAWERFYGKLAEHHNAMHEIDHAWTRTLFEAVAVLDVVQIETRVDADTSSWKAVLLPTHPLHLWRYERMASLARGLKLEGSDREAVLAELERPEHYLGVLYLTSFPEGRGGSRPLPVARNYRGLAVFENFKNAYSGLEGVEALQRCIRQFALIYVNHTQPLRIALLNPPDASRLLVRLLDALQLPRGANTTLLIDVYATPDHKNRLRDARRLSMTERDQLEEHIRNGRLRLRVHDELLPLDERLKRFRDAPVHIVAVFDEATTAMRRTPGGTNLLPMSPFAVRRRIEFQGIKKKVELQPSAEETVFRSFYDMVAKLEGAAKGGTPQASADAERMRHHIEEVLLDENPGAFWFFFADRALPSPGGIRAARILERQGRHRRAVCYDASYERLALLLRVPLDQFNLRFPPEELEELLQEGVALIGDGLVDLLKPDGQPDTARVRGLAGTLIAARDYKDRHPDSLLVSVDSELARLWLRLSRHGERCDLLALRNDGDDLVVEVIEVKTCGTGAEVARAEIDKARSQLSATLEAVRSGLQEDEEVPERSPLAAPRQEMLKEVFVHGCQSLTALPADRERWAEWLKALFGEGAASGASRLRGIVYAIELGHNSPPDESAVVDEPFTVLVRRIRETRIQELISSRRSPGQSGGDSGSDREPPVPPAKPIKPSFDSPRPVLGGVRAVVAPTRNASAIPPDAPLAKPAFDGLTKSQGIRFCVGESSGIGTPQNYYFHPSNTKLNQLNIGIVGDLGTGKTQLTKALIYQLTRAAEQNRGHAPKFLIFDYKRDYTKPDFVDAVGARVVKPHHIPLNLFDLGATGDHTIGARLGRVKFLNDVLQKIYGGIGPRQRNHLKTAVLQAYESASGGTPTLRDVLVEYEAIVGDKIDAPYSILSDLADLEIFVPNAADAITFREFFNGVVVIDLAALGIGEKERNMLLVMFLNLFYEYMQGLEKRPYIGETPQLRFIDSMLLVDEADNIMKFNFDVLRQILLQGREFGVGVLLASQYLSHFKTRETDYAEPLLTWFLHKVPNVTVRELDAIGLSNVGPSMIDRVKSLDVHQCLFKTLDVPGRFMRGTPFYELLNDPLRRNYG
ncbi:hypothetical protein [Mesorhizobium shangrilense]|uniref:ATP-binding protein n=1 Tax=Mesorhizobium shangrilense TaxID=460060 RepID=A0ABV2DSK7_9HYPH